MGLLITGSPVSDATVERLSVVIICGSIAPYSNRLFDSIAAAHKLDLHVLSCAELEPHRRWTVPAPIKYRLKVLAGLRLHYRLRHFYFNPGVIWELIRLKPSAIIIGSFSPTMIMAAIYAYLTRTQLGVSTDGSIATDPGSKSLLHRWIRQIIIPRAAFGIGASEASTLLLGQYGLPRKRCDIVPLVPAWDAPSTRPNFHERPYDVLFCGLLDESKGLSFLVEVLAACKSHGHSLRVRIAGDGPMRGLLEQRLESLGLLVHFDGYVQMQQLSEVYSSAKLLLFPTLGDAWGLVVNEASLCGTPVICSPRAVSSMELVERYNIGRMIPLDVKNWRDTIIGALTDRCIWEVWQNNCNQAKDSFSLKLATKRYGHVVAKIRDFRVHGKALSQSERRR